MSLLNHAEHLSFSVLGGDLTTSVCNEIVL